MTECRLQFTNAVTRYSGVLQRGVHRLLNNMVRVLSHHPCHDMETRQEEALSYERRNFIAPFNGGVDHCTLKVSRSEGVKTSCSNFSLSSRALVQR